METDLPRPPPPPKTLEEAYELILALRAENAALREEDGQLRTENAALKARVAELEERLRTNSGNSSMPPSSDGPAVARPPPAKPPSSGRRLPRQTAVGPRRLLI